MSNCTRTTWNNCSKNKLECSKNNVLGTFELVRDVSRNHKCDSYKSSNHLNICCFFVKKAFCFVDSKLMGSKKKYFQECMVIGKSLRERDGNSNKVDGKGMEIGTNSMETVENGNEIASTGG